MAYLEAFLSYIDIKTTLAFVAVFLLLSNVFRQRINLPPGPMCLPLLGSLPSLAFNILRSGDTPEVMLTKMAKTYGDVFSLKVGTKVVVVCNGYNSIKEAFQNPIMNDRPKSYMMEELSIHEGIPTTTGKSWRYQRNLTESAFRNFGVGRSSFEGNITEEAKTLMESINQFGGKSFDSHILLGNCVTNVICSVAFGKRYDHSDPVFQRLISVFDKLTTDIGSGGILLFLPIMRYISPTKFQNCLSNHLNFISEASNIVKEHEEVFDRDNINDITDIFLKEIELARNRDDDYKDYIHIRSLIATSVFFFLAGAETVATTLRWALLYMIKYPDIQRKVQKEMDSVVGRDQMPGWADRLSLPYTQAVILEVQRMRPALTLGFPHATSADTTLCGYGVPQGSIIVPNMWAVHHSPDVWTEPDQFKPEHFLNENGELLNREELIPFSVGHRVCLGKNLAKMELFIFFTHLLHRFTIRAPNGGQSISSKGVSGITFAPEPYEIVAEKRI